MCLKSIHMIALHIIAMVSTVIGALVKSILMLSNKKEAFRKVHAKTSMAIRILMIVGVLAGVFIIVTKFGGIIPPWLMIKLGIFIIGGLTVMMAEKKENKLWMAIGTAMLLLVIVQANVKLNP
jgi:hypothetical protein